MTVGVLCQTIFHVRSRVNVQRLKTTNRIALRTAKVCAWFGVTL